VVYQREGKYKQAEPLLRNTLESFRRVLGADHPYTLTATAGLVAVYLWEAKYAEGEALENSLVQARRRVLGDEHPDTLNSLDTLAELYHRQRKYDRAERLLARVVAMRRRVMGPQHRDTLATLVSLGKVRIHQEKYADAGLPLGEALRAYETTMPEHWRRYLVQVLMGASLAGREKFEEAESLLVNGYRGLLQRKDSIPANSRLDLAEAEEWIVRLYQKWGKPAQVAEWRQRIHSGEPAGSAAH
jgi:tetratricopeptide (TPR) repeat protein